MPPANNIPGTSMLSTRRPGNPAQEATELFECYLPEQAERLQRRLNGSAWQRLLRSGAVAAARQARAETPAEPAPDRLAADHLIARNEAAARARIAAGERDRESLLAILARWNDSGAADVPLPGLSFLGLCLTWACNAVPKCRYCNQQPTARRMRLAHWKRVITRAAESGGRPYVYMTGGEPLLWRERLYGPDGLIRHATARGCPANINTNAFLLTPHVAIQLVASGLAKLHVSLDSADPAVHDRLAGAPGCWQRALAGIENIQIARELLGVDRPVVHVNCVLTRENARGWPELVRLILHVKKQRSAGHQGSRRGDPVFRELGAHLIPVGGPQNAALRLAADEIRRFHQETWERAAAVWDEYQEETGVPPGERVAFNDWAFFASAWRRVAHRGTLAEYAAACVAGEYARLALGPRCHIVPTQAFVLPDGSQYWCGAHYVSRPEPVGNVLESDLVGNIRRSLPQVAGFPGPRCRNCATATLFLNQGIEKTLGAKVEAWIKEAESEAGPSPG
ncbi:MAG: radical SAM protein [Armatimonadetes bacterium]|nr:radical SAM protein [Armatimonadota bacterium]